MPRPPTWDHLKSAKKPLEIRHPVYLDDEPIERLEKLREEVERAKTRELALKETPAHPDARDDLERLERDLSAAEDAVRESTAWFVIRQPSPKGRKRYEALVEAHPPTEGQVKEATEKGQDKPPYNDETFYPALLSLACAEPLLTVEEATELFDQWTHTECLPLVAACLAVCTGRRTVDLGKG